MQNISNSLLLKLKYFSYQTAKKKTQHDGCNESRDGRNFLIGHVKLESIDSLQQNVQMQSPHQNEVLPSSETAPQTKSNIEKP